MKKVSVRKTNTAKKSTPSVSSMRKGKLQPKALTKTAKKTAVEVSRLKQTRVDKGEKKSTLTKKLLNDIKKRLIAQKKSLLAEAEDALNSLPGEINFPDLGDQATAEIDRNFMLRLRGRERKLLKKIDEAIERIDAGTFGICEMCGEEIDIRRITARPVTTLCIDCKTLQEEEERMREGS